MDTETLLEVTETEALHVVICNNAEVLGVDDDDRRAMVDAATLGVEDAAGTCFAPDAEGWFADWRGGTYSKANLGYGNCYISLCKRVLLAAATADEEAQYGEWEWAADETASPEAKALAEKIADAASAAFGKVKDEIERENARAEAEAEKEAKDAEAEEA